MLQMIESLLGLPAGSLSDVQNDPAMAELLKEMMDERVLAPLITFLKTSYEKYDAAPSRSLAALLLLAKRHPNEFKDLLKNNG